MRWHRRVRGGHAAAAHSSASAHHGDGTPHERRHGGPSEDRALYTCECGYAFEALVTTSVGCPHCARTQAW
ncbi:MAG TPA: hypothetical protein VMJ65_17690 [Solirubrobacteraceae bacterium]|nr:hypothetical protein [Solirubrobacteraceae bacterium]